MLPHLEEVVVRTLIVPLFKTSDGSSSFNLLHMVAPNIFKAAAAELLLVIWLLIIILLSKLFLDITKQN